MILHRTNVLENIFSSFVNQSKLIPVYTESRQYLKKAKKNALSK